MRGALAKQHKRFLRLFGWVWHMHRGSARKIEEVPVWSEIQPSEWVAA